MLSHGRQGRIICGFSFWQSAGFWRFCWTSFLYTILFHLPALAGKFFSGSVYAAESNGRFREYLVWSSVWFFIRQWPWLILATLIYAVLIYIWIASKGETPVQRETAAGSEKTESGFPWSAGSSRSLECFTEHHTVSDVWNWWIQWEPESDIGSVRTILRGSAVYKITFPDKKKIWFISCVNPWRVPLPARMKAADSRRA